MNLLNYFKTRTEEKKLQKICDSLPKIDFAKKAKELSSLSNEQIEAFAFICHLIDWSDAICMNIHPEDMGELSRKTLQIIDKAILREARKFTKK